MRTLLVAVMLAGCASVAAPGADGGPVDAWIDQAPDGGPDGGNCWIETPGGYQCCGMRAGPYCCDTRTPPSPCHMPNEWWCVTSSGAESCHAFR